MRLLWELMLRDYYFVPHTYGDRALVLTDAESRCPVSEAPLFGNVSQFTLSVPSDTKSTIVMKRKLHCQSTVLITGRNVCTSNLGLINVCAVGLQNTLTPMDLVR
jgi:hypothetical protein